MLFLSNKQQGTLYPADLIIYSGHCTSVISG